MNDDIERVLSASSDPANYYVDINIAALLTAKRQRMEKVWKALLEWSEDWEPWGDAYASCTDSNGGWSHDDAENYHKVFRLLYELQELQS